MITEHPALDAELETTLRQDTNGIFLEDMQRSLRAFIAAVEFHTRSGLDAQQYVQWRDLQKAAEAAALAVEEVHQRMHHGFGNGADPD